MEGAQNKPEFLAMNPYHHIPTLKDGEVTLGESAAILHYLALKYKPEYYPVSDPVACGRIDFAMNSFKCEVYEGLHDKSIYGVMGFGPPPEDQAGMNKKFTEQLDAWTGH